METDCPFRGAHGTPDAGGRASADLSRSYRQRHAVRTPEPCAHLRPTSGAWHVPDPTSGAWRVPDPTVARTRVVAKRPVASFRLLSGARLGRHTSGTCLVRA